MNSEVQYLLLKWNKMLLFLIIHLPMYDISYVHHCNDTSSSHSFAKLLKNTERTFCYEPGNKNCLFWANATRNSITLISTIEKALFHWCVSQPMVVNVNILSDKNLVGLWHFKAKKLYFDFKCWLYWICFPPQISSRTLQAGIEQELKRSWMSHSPRLL